MGSVDLLRFLVFPLLSASSPRALNDAFFSLRVREVAASGLRGEDTAGRCSSSRRVVGRAGGAVTGEGCWVSAIATGFGGMKLSSKISWVLYVTKMFGDLGPSLFRSDAR